MNPQPARHLSTDLTQTNIQTESDGQLPRKQRRAMCKCSMPWLLQQHTTTQTHDTGTWPPQGLPQRLAPLRGGRTFKKWGLRSVGASLEGAVCLGCLCCSSDLCGSAMCSYQNLPLAGGPQPRATHPFTLQTMSPNKTLFCKN